MGISQGVYTRLIMEILLLVVIVIAVIVSLNL